MSSPAVLNARLFQEPERRNIYLRARGFDVKSGARSGGIKEPRPVDLAPGVILLRTYQDPARFLGEWWITPNEMVQVINYFARDGAAFSEGRSQGKGILQATLAVRHEWGDNSPGHLGLVGAVRLVKPLRAFFGEGDIAPDASQRKNLKPVKIIDVTNCQRGVRQVFLPEPWNYQDALSVLQREASSDIDLIRLAETNNSGPNPFEK